MNFIRLKDYHFNRYIYVVDDKIEAVYTNYNGYTEVRLISGGIFTVEGTCEEIIDYINSDEEIEK